MSDLPGGAKIPVVFKPGQPLTATELNEVQKALMLLLLTHNHSGNEQAAPQGVAIGAEGIANNAIKGQHISVNAVAKGDIHNGAVGASEIAEKCVASNHLVDGAVTTPQIKDQAVTMAKLSDEVLALLNTPREGATTYAYAAYLQGEIAYPAQAGRWFDWLVERDLPVRVHDLPIRRLRDDGGWMPVRSILPPEKLRPIIPHVDMTTRAEMASSMASIFKQNESVLMDVVGAPVTEVRAEGNGWVITLGAREKRILNNAEMQDLVGRIGRVGADLSPMASPLRANSALTLSTAFEKLATEEPSTSLRMAAARPVNPILAPAPEPIFRQPRLPVGGSRQLPVDPVLFLDPTPSDDHLERGRVAMLVDPQAIGWQIPQEGTTFFQPGVGGNAAFTDNGQAITFATDRKPSKDEIVVLNRILYHYGIQDDERLDPDILLSMPKFHDFLNNPHLMAAGFWTGTARNIRSVVRMSSRNLPYVRVRFNTPYSNASYVVSVSPDYQFESEGYYPVTAHVLRRTAEFVDLLFFRNGEPENRLSFSIAIHGELVES